MIRKSKLKAWTLLKIIWSISERRKGLPAIRIYDLKSGESHEINFDEPTYEVSLDRNPVFDTNVVRIDYSSFITPNSVIDYDMASRRKELREGDDRARRVQEERLCFRAHLCEGR